MHAGRCPTCQMAQMTRFRKSLRQASAGGLWSSSCEFWVQLWSLMCGISGDCLDLMGIWLITVYTGGSTQLCCRLHLRCQPLIANQAPRAVLPINLLLAANSSATCLSRVCQDCC